jgi:hypothetical protein
MEDVLSPRSWWHLIAGVLTVVAGFLGVLSITAPVRNSGDLAPVHGTVTRIATDTRGNIIIALGAEQPLLQILRNDQRFLDEEAFRRKVRVGDPLTALVIAKRLHEGASPLNVFGLAGAQVSYLRPEPMIAARQYEILVVLPGIALTLGSMAAAALWLGFRDLRRQRELQESPPGLARYRVGLAKLRVIGALNLLMFSSFAVMAWMSQQQGPALAFVVFATIGLALIGSAGTIEVDDQAIVVHNGPTQHRIAWTEVREFLHDHRAQQLVFRGMDKQLAILGPSYWSGPHRLVLYDYLMTQLVSRAIPIRESAKATLARSRNTRVDLR